MKKILNRSKICWFFIVLSPLSLAVKMKKGETLPTITVDELRQLDVIPKQ